jgi:hypothetical protein
MANRRSISDEAVLGHPLAGPLHGWLRDSVWHVCGTKSISASDEAVPIAKKYRVTSTFTRGRDRHRSGDLALFRRALYQLSYPTSRLSPHLATTTGTSVAVATPEPSERT